MTEGRSAHVTCDPQDLGSADVGRGGCSSTSRSSTAYIGLGANLGERLPALRHARLRIGDLGAVRATSPVYETAPVGFLDQPPFLNAALSLATDLGPDELMSNLLQIERDLGRVRTFPNAPRALDLDLLVYDDAVLDLPDLVVPHPRMHERAFVLVPLNDIAPDLLHPSLAVSVGGLLKQLGPVTDVHLTPLSLVEISDDGRSVLTDHP